MHRRRVDLTSDRPAYRQLADILRDEITSGRLQPGDSLPSEYRLAQEYEIGRDTVRDAFSVLRSEGLIETTRGRPSRVRAPRRLHTITAESGTQVTSRMPTEDERKRLGMVEGVPILVVTADTGLRIYPADSTVVEVP